jgi:hypothetical protein
MKRTFKTTLGLATGTAFFFLLIFYISSCNGGSTNPSTAGSGLYKPSAKDMIITLPDPVKAGSQIVLEPIIDPDSSSNHGSGLGGKAKIKLPCFIPYDIPAHTTLRIRFVPTEILNDSAQVKK